MIRDTVNIALVGMGIVGSALVDIFRRNLPLLEDKAGTRLRLSWIADLRRTPFKDPIQKPRLTKDWRQVVRDPSVDIVVELIGGYEPARTVVLEALRAGKHVATANKALLAKHWDEVFKTAQEHRGLLYFEASVGSGIPVIQGLNEGMAANRIERIYGILNGTTNYILTRMTNEGLSFAAALKGAQKAGFAEADPTLDVEGVDAANKLAILASLAAGAWVRLEDVFVEGVTDLDAWDVHFARRKLGMVTKLLGIAHLDGDRVSARVHPALIPAAHPFANVSAEYNAIIVHGDAAGDVMFYGKGAGGPAAASAVVSDIIYLARQVASGGRAGQMPYVTIHGERRPVAVPLEEVVCRHYLRFTAKDRPGVLAQLAGILGRHKVSIASVHQDEGRGRGVPIVFITHRVPEGAVAAALKEADRLSTTLKKAVRLRIEDFS
jgi:homoserine dehydrogenase